MKVIVTGYMDTLSVDEGFDAGVVFPSTKYSVNVGDMVVAVANTKNGVEGMMIQADSIVPNYMAKRIFTRKKQKRSNKSAIGGTPIKRFTIPNKKVGIFHGGVVGRKDGSQDMVKNYVFGEG